MALRASTCLCVNVLLVSGALRGAPAPGEAGPQALAAWVVVVEADRLMVQLDRGPLVVAQLARQAGLKVPGREAGGDVLVSASLRDLPLAEGTEGSERSRSAARRASSSGSRTGRAESVASGHQLGYAINHENDAHPR